jgi:hypothetical protein
MFINGNAQPDLDNGLHDLYNANVDSYLDLHMLLEKVDGLLLVAVGLYPFLMAAKCNLFLLLRM